MQKCQYLYEKLTRKAYAGNMKSEIKYNAAGDALETIGRWQDWLKSERGYSEHTLDAYFRDLSAFFAFFERPLTLAKLGRLDVRDFRAYLASRAAKHLEKSSIAREVSAVKNFFKWLDRNNIVKNPAISVISSPRKSKILPKALDIDDAFDVLRRAAEMQNAKNPGDAILDESARQSRLYPALRLRTAYFGSVVAERRRSGQRRFHANYR